MKRRARGTLGEEWARNKLKEVVIRWSEGRMLEDKASLREKFVTSWMRTGKGVEGWWG